MKRLTGLMVVVLMNLAAVAQEVNVFTIPNQTAHFIRMPSRESSTEIDAAFSNPAGLTKLEDGFHFSINNQVVIQDIHLSSDYQYLNEVPTHYKGKLRAYFFPGIFLAWKKNNLVISGGAMLAGGGGGASFNNLPSADMGLADVGPALKISLLDGINESIVRNTGTDPGYNDIRGYSFDFYSKGVAYYPGYQITASYMLNHYISFAAGVRYVNATVRSDGYVRNIQIDVLQHGGYQSPTDYLNYLAQQPELTAVQSALVEGVATLYAELSQDRLIEVQQKGHGFTPIIGLHSSPSDKLDVGLKYEHRTKVELTTNVIDGNDGGGEFEDGKVIRSDLPGFISMGVRYQLFPKLATAIGSRIFFDKSADYNGREKLINKNYYELSSGIEYAVSDKVKISGGYTFNKANVDKEYHSEVDFRTPGHSVAIGGAYAFTEDVTVNAGFLFTKFIRQTNTYEHVFADGNVEADPIPYNLTMHKNVFLIALGVDFSLTN